ncbi:hypothetical protein R6Z07F_003821 [Ovis aries]
METGKEKSRHKESANNKGKDKAHSRSYLSRVKNQAPHSRNPQGLALLPAGSPAAFRTRPHTPAARCRWPAEQQPRCPEPRHDPEPHPAHRKSPTGKQPLAGDVVRKPQSRERAGKPSREAGPNGTPCARTTSPPPGKAWVRD